MILSIEAATDQNISYLHSECDQKKLAEILCRLCTHVSKHEAFFIVLNRV